MFKSTFTLNQCNILWQLWFLNVLSLFFSNKYVLYFIADVLKNMRKSSHQGVHVAVGQEDGWPIAGLGSRQTPYKGGWGIAPPPAPPLLDSVEKPRQRPSGGGWAIGSGIAFLGAWCGIRNGPFWTNEVKKAKSVSTLLSCFPQPVKHVIWDWTQDCCNMYTALRLRVSRSNHTLGQILLY